MTYRILDTFCGAGGAGMGYHLAGFEVVGVDSAPQKHYPFEFHQADALEYIAEHGREFDAIHASPPCQGYSRLRHLPWLKDKQWPKLIVEVRNLLMGIERPYIIENVEDAPIAGMILCGRSFGLPLYRHRRFETSWFIFQAGHPRHDVVIGHGRMVNDRRKGSLNNSSAKGAWGNQRIVTVAGGQFRKEDGVKALGIDWMTKDELAEAIPPAYTKFIGEQLIVYLEGGIAYG